MAKKPAIAKEGTAAAKPARAAKPRAPRVPVAHHKATPIESVEVLEIAAEPVASPAASPLTVPANAQEAISLIAYGYWQARGGQGGSALEDWVRAEEEYRNSLR